MTRKIKIIYLSIIFGLLAVGLFFKPEFLFFNATRLGNNQTLEFRFWAWRAGLECWWQRPFIGYGPEQYIICFNEKFNPKFMDSATAVTWYDRPHNFFLGQLVETGLIGFSAFLLFLYAIFKTIWKMPKAEKLILVPCLSAYGISLFFFFPSFVDSVLFIILISYAQNHQKINE